MQCKAISPWYPSIGGLICRSALLNHSGFHAGIRFATGGCLQHPGFFHKILARHKQSVQPGGFNCGSPC
jgi:hypothetical protein